MSGFSFCASFVLLLCLFVASCTRLLDCGPFRIIHSLLEGTGSRPVGSRPLFLLAKTFGG